MPKICYEPRKFKPESLKTITTANEILEDYARQGYDLTLRQLYYQFVSRGLIENTSKSYDNLGSLINDARLAGRVDWDHITDRTRNMRENGHWDTPASIIRACGDQFQINKWERQHNYVEVWVEKDALVGVLEVACKPLDVAYFSCRGYTSQSEMWIAGQRLLKQLQAGKSVTILHLGDHDPSGIDMTRDIAHRLNGFAVYHTVREWINANARGTEESPAEYKERIRESLDGDPIDVKRIALNMAQIEQYNPPPNPAKLSDSRAAKYVEEYGDESWELDALEPSVITALIEEEVTELRNETQWQKDKAAEQVHRAKLLACAGQWDKVAASL